MGERGGRGLIRDGRYACTTPPQHIWDDRTSMHLHADGAQTDLALGQITFERVCLNGEQFKAGLTEESRK